MKRVLSFTLSLVLVITSFFALGVNALALDSEGTAGDNITYTFDAETGALVLSGTGKIKNYAFSGSKDIKSVTIGEGITEVGTDAFNNCTNITSVSFPSTLEVISSYAFGHNSGLTEIVIPNGVTTVSVCAFGYCENIRSVSLPASVAYMDGASFDTTSMTEFTIDEENPYFKAHDGNLYSADMTKFIVYCGAKQDAAFVLPDTVRSISDYAFSTAPNLRKITLPDGMTKVDSSAFRGCSFVEEIVLPDTITKIESGAFEYCSGLKKLDIPSGVTEIGSYAFDGCSSLEKLVIPVGVTMIYSYTFMLCDVLHVYFMNPECTFGDYPYIVSDMVTIHSNERCDGTSAPKDFAEKKGLAYETIEVAAHEYEQTASVEPTCGKAGAADYVCKNCGATKTEEIPATGKHTWNAGVVTKKATPTATGVKTYTCTVCGAKKTATIAKCAKYANPLTAKAKKPTVKYSKLKKKNQTITAKNAVTVSKAQGKVTYKKSSGNKKITVASNGKITVKKGLKKGTYKVKIKVTAAGNASYKSGSKTVTVTIKVK